MVGSLGGACSGQVVPCENRIIGVPQETLPIEKGVASIQGVGEFEFDPSAHQEKME